MRSTHPAQLVVLQDYVNVVTDAGTRMKRLTGRSADLLPRQSLASVVAAVRDEKLTVA